MTRSHREAYLGGGSSRLRWCYEDFCWFYERLTLPEGTPTLLEGHLRLILREIFGLGGDSSLLVMLPKGNGKTALMGALAVFHLLVTPNANCFIGAANQKQAKEMYRFACHFIRAGSNWELEQYCKIKGGTLEITSKRDEGFILILASDDSKQQGKNQGLNATLFLLDELHAHDNDSLYTDGRSGLFKRQGIMVTITTAGWDVESTLGKLRTNFLAADQAGGTVETGLEVTERGGYVYRPEVGRLTVARLGDNVMLEWALRPKGHPLGEDDPEDFEVVKLCNPASWVTVKSIRNAFEDPGTTPWVYRRYRCNLWSLAFESWLPAGAWESLWHADVVVVEHRSWLGATNDELDAHIASLFEPGVRLIGAQDMGRYRDSAAATVLGPGPDGLVLPRAVIWRSGGKDNPVPYGPVERAWERLHERYTLEAVGYDDKYFDASAERLLELGLPMELFSQSNERMCPAAADLRTDILSGREVDGEIRGERVFAHDGDPILTAHIVATTAKDVGDGSFKLVKSKDSGPPIDGCVSLAMANRLRRLEAGDGEALGAWA